MADSGEKFDFEQEFLNILAYNAEHNSLIEGTALGMAVAEDT